MRVSTLLAKPQSSTSFHPLPRRKNVERYSTYNTIELSYRVGLLARAEWRRLFRAYEIRGDLEHEDEQYEATPEDCFYVFKTCIDYVLARDPIEVVRLIDVKNIVEQPAAATLSQPVIDDFQHAPEVRQLEIVRFLISNALNKSVPDVVRQNCYAALAALRPVTHKQVLITASQEFVQRIGRGAPDLLHARIAFAAGIFPYLKKSQIGEFFKAVLEQMKKTGFSFRSHGQHGELLRNLRDVGGLTFCPDELKVALLEWLVLCNIGELGGYGAGWNRRVFYSNVGAPLAFDLIKDSAGSLKASFDQVKLTHDVQSALADSHVERRFEAINDLFNV